MTLSTKHSISQGRLSDRIGRQAVITIALLFQIVTALGLILTKNYELDLLFAIAFGIGNASFNGSTFALLADILPSLHGDGESPKNGFVIGLSTVSMTLPSVLAPLLDGFIIDSQHARGRYEKFFVQLMFM
jgi:MFS family permease